MPSLQLLQLTDRGRGLLASRRSVGSDHSLTRQIPSFHFPLLAVLPNCAVRAFVSSPSSQSLCAQPTRRTLAVVSGAVLAGGALAYARSSQSRRRRRTEANRGGEAGALAANGDGLSQNGAGGGLVAAKQRRSGLKSLHFLAAILLKKIGPSGTRYLLGLVLTAVGSAIFL